jgi:hypothetical protein
MAKGKARVNYLGRAGLVASADAPDWSFIYEASAVKHPHYNLGDRVVLPDGRVFRYAKAGGDINCDYGCKFYEDEVETYRTVYTSGAVGDKSVTVDGSSHAALTKDELRGGYVIIYHTGGGGYTQFRGIVGNDAAAANADFTIYLDAALDVAITAASTGIEVFYNPWADVRSGNSVGNAYSVAGRPARNASSGQYFWVQTWGPIWIAPSESFSTGYNRGAYFDSDGSIHPAVAVGSLDSSDSTQYAGFLMNEGYTTGPLLMLQVCP